MRILNWLFMIVFLVSAVLQYNDPDPYIWIPIYVFAAALCIHALKKEFRPALYIIGFAVFIPYALYLFFENDGVLSWWNEHNAENIAQSMMATRPWIEATREFFGLMLVLISMTLNWFWLRRDFAERKN